MTRGRIQLKNRRIAAVVTSLLLGPGAGQLALGRTARALLWIALLWGAVLGTVFLGIWLLMAVLVIYLGSVIDSALIRPPAVRMPGWGKVLLLWILLAAASVGLRNGLTLFVVEAFKTPSGAMRPTLQPGDHFWVRKDASQQLRRGSVIVFRRQKRMMIKRVVALGGDTVELRANALYLNGRAVERRRSTDECSYKDLDEQGAVQGEVKCVPFAEKAGDRRYRVIQTPAPPSEMQPREVPKGHVFVLGDNRDNSFDSRQYGPIPLANVVGEVTRIWFSAGAGGIRWQRIEREVR